MHDGWELLMWKPKNKENSPLRKELDKLLDGSAQGFKKMLFLTKILKEKGPYALSMPHNENLKDGLFELRDNNTGNRYYYCDTDFVLSGQKKKIILLILACGNKNTKNGQSRDIEYARKRMQEIDISNIELETELDIIERKGK